MVLMMSRPHKHPKTGVYYFRRAVPADLRTIIGKREELRSLGTKDPIWLASFMRRLRLR